MSRTLLALAVALAVPLSGLNAGAVAAADPGEPRIPDAVMSGRGSGPAPVQRSGSAAGLDAVDGDGGNAERPPSLRSSFPLFQAEPAEAPVQQVVEDKPADPQPVNGFNAATSREMPARRDKFAQSFRNSDGTETTVFSLDPVNYKRPDGSWAPIDTNLRQDTASGDWVVTKAGYRTRIGARLDDGMATVTLDAGHELAWSIDGARGVSAGVSGNKVIYREFASGADLELEVRGGGVKETVVLRSKDAPRRFTFPLQLKGLTAELAGGDVVLRDRSGNQRALIPAGSMEDSAVGTKASSRRVAYRLVTIGGAAALRVEVDDAWLDDPARVWPVRVDPTVLPTDEFNSNYAVTVRPGGADLGTQRLELGWKNGGGSAAYLSFGHVSNNLAYHRITGAELAVMSYDAPSCSERAVRVHGVKEAWQLTPREQLRFPGPPVTAALTTVSFANGYIKTGATSSACGARWQRLNLWTAGRNLVQDWVNQKGNYGLALRAGSETDPLAWKAFIGTQSANPPKLFVTHSPYNAGYDVQPLVNPETDAVLQDRAGKIPVKITNTGAWTWTPESYYLTYRVFDSAGRRITTQPELQTVLPGDIVRMASRTVMANVQALPGSTSGTPYRIEFTMVHKASGGNRAFTDNLVPPGVANIEVYNIRPSFTKLWPVNGYQSTSLTPNLWAVATDADAPDSTVTYKFEVCEVVGSDPRVNCFVNGDYSSIRSWTVPAGRLSWNRRYQWRAYARDNDGAVTNGPAVVLLTDVPQPPVTSKIANSPLGSGDKEYDPQVGNFSTSALDASVPVAGPGLNVTRTFNSLDPRRDRAFGVGWSGLQDMVLIPETNGNAVITYPDGQQVRFGKNPDGKYVAAPNRKATLVRDAGGTWQLTVAGGTEYVFSANGILDRVIGLNDLQLRFAYRADGTLETVTSTNGGSGRTLTFAWTADKRHVASVSTDAVDGAPLTWIYTYAGDVLTKVCNPSNECTSYESGRGSHYRSAVLDSRPDAYYRLGDVDADHNNASNQIDLNFDLNRDNGRYAGAVPGVAGALAGTGETATSFNGSSAYVELPAGSVRRNRDQAVEMWFRTSAAGARPLLGYQSHQIASASTNGAVPALYVGADGRLRGQFWNGVADPITSTGAVNNGQWHHVVLTASGTSQAMFLDGALVGTVGGRAIVHDTLGYNQLGAAYSASGNGWPSWTTATRAYFQGEIDEVALYSHPLNYGDIWAHWAAGRVAADQVTSVTSPGGRQKSRVSYDTAMNRVREYADAQGGTWTIGSPQSISTATDLRRIVTVRDPADRPSVYEYDGLGGWLLRTGRPIATDVSGDDPVFNWTTGEGFAIRSFTHDAWGRLVKITGETGGVLTMAYDSRGNVASKKTCRTGTTNCFTEWMTYHAGSWPETDPRWDKPAAVRDGRSSGSTDDRFKSTSSFTATGQLSVQKSPDGAQVTYAYTFGTEAGPDGKTMPAGLLRTVTGQAGAVTTYTYFATGQLAEVKTPSGLRTQYTYDAVGRKLTETQISDSHPDGVTTTYTYDKASRTKTATGPETADAVTGVKHRQRVEFAYDADGRVTKTTTSDLVGGGDPRVTTVVYDDRGRPERTVDAVGNETNVAYDEFGNVTRTQDANGTVQELRYTALNLLAEVRLQDPAGTGATDEYKVLQSLGYDKAGRKVRETDAMGRSRLYTYYDDDLVSSVVLEDFRNPDGTFRDFTLEQNQYDGAGYLTRAIADNTKTTTDFTYDVVGRVKTRTVNPGGVSRQSTYDYDLAGNTIKEVLTGAWSNVSPLPSPTTRTREYDYDVAGRLLSEIVQNSTGPALVTSWAHDQRNLVRSTTSPRGNVAGAVKADFTTTYAYDELGRRVRVVAPKVTVEENGGAPVQAEPTSVTGYDGFGLAASTKDARGNIHRTTYDRLGRPVESIAPTYTPPGGAAIEPKTQVEYDAIGQVIAATDARGNTIRYGYDRRGRQGRVDAPASTNDERAVWAYTYHDNGQVASVTDPLGAVQQWTYDQLDRVETQTVVERQPTTANFVTRWAYDDQGNVTSEVSPSGATVTNAYDTLGQLVKVTDQNGVQSHLGYDGAGRHVRLADAMGRSTSWEFDLAGRMVSSTDKDAAGNGLGTRSLGYDPDGNVVSDTPPGGTRATTYAYDAVGRLTTQVDPATDTTSVTTGLGYDPAGNRTRYTDGRGNATVYSFNVLGLPESVIEPSTVAHPAAADRTWTASYDAAGNAGSLLSPGGVRRTRTFDAAGRLTKEEGTGAEAATVAREVGYDLASQVTSISSYNGVNVQTYNDRGLMLRSDGPSGPASYGYDPDGQVTQRIDASGTSDFTYDKGRLATATDSVTRTVHTVGYNAAGQLASIDYGSGRTRTLGYDPYGRVNSDVLNNGAGAVVGSVGYGYDARGRITSKKTTGVSGAGEHSYSHDQLGRLTRWQVGSKVTEYGWDQASNRTLVKTSAGEQVARFDERNRLISDGVADYSYSPRGALLSKTTGSTTETFSFDAFDRLIRLSDRDYTYDALDRPVAITSSTATVRMRYAGFSDEVVGDGTQHFGRGPGGELLSISQDTTKRLVLSDRHQDVVGGFDPADAALATGLPDTRTYDPWGKLTHASGLKYRVGYQGDWTDPRSDHVNQGARWYDPSTGAFDSRDTVTYPAGTPSNRPNLYAYAGGNPINHLDPTGNRVPDEPGHNASCYYEQLDGPVLVCPGDRAGTRTRATARRTTVSIHVPVVTASSPLSSNVPALAVAGSRRHRLVRSARNRSARNRRPSMSRAVDRNARASRRNLRATPSASRRRPSFAPSEPRTTSKRSCLPSR